MQAQATSFQFPRFRWDCAHNWVLFTVCERVICVNGYLVVGGVVIAPVVVAIVERLKALVCLPKRVGGRGPSTASVPDYALSVRAFRDVAHNVGVGITLPVRPVVSHNCG
jgi:hypothetical protein